MVKKTGVIKTGVIKTLRMVADDRAWWALEFAKAAEGQPVRYFIVRYESRQEPVTIANLHGWATSEAMAVELFERYAASGMTVPSRLRSV